MQVNNGGQSPQQNYQLLHHQFTPNNQSLGGAPQMR